MRYPQEVKGDKRLGEELIPKLHQEVRVRAPHEREVVGLPCVDRTFGGVPLVYSYRSKLKFNLIAVKESNERGGRFIVEALEGGAESSRHNHFVCSLVRKEDLVTCPQRHCFDVNIIHVEAVQHGHVCVACSGPM